MDGLRAESSDTTAVVILKEREQLLQSCTEVQLAEPFRPTLYPSVSATSVNRTR